MKIDTAAMEFLPRETPRTPQGERKLREIMEVGGHGPGVDISSLRLYYSGRAAGEPDWRRYLWKLAAHRRAN